MMEAEKRYDEVAADDYQGDGSPLNLMAYEPLARSRLPEMAFGYYVSGADDEVTLHDNRTAYDRIRLAPHMLRGVGQRHTSVEILGQKYAAPIMVAPMAFMRMAHPDGEAAVAASVTQHGLGMTLSTMSTTTLEEVAKAADSRLWFQLYVYRDRAITESLVKRAETAGYRALVVTVDTPLLGRREADVRNNFHLPEGLQAANLQGPATEDVGEARNESGLAAYVASLWDSDLDWKSIEWLRSITSLPILLKGILRADDARLAIEHGASGIIVSNHGGRQLDTAPATIDALPAVADEVAGRIPVLLDGGIRRGTDVVKALCYGADAVMVGRPVMWALAVDGRAGVDHVFDMLLRELDLAMALCGCRSIDELTRDLIFRPYQRG